MRFDNKDVIAELGVTAVKHAVLSELKWIFREQPLQDKGIDAHIEQSVDGRATGRLIGLQIKSGLSWFMEKNEEGVIYRGDLKHYAYWKNYSLPVIIVLYEPDKNRAYWQKISDKTVKITDAGWKIVVPFSQTVGRDALLPWTNLCQSDVAKELERQKREIGELSTEVRQGADRRLALLYRAFHLSRKFVFFYSPFVSTRLLTVFDFISVQTPVRAIIGAQQTEDTLALLRRRCSSALQVKIVPQIHKKEIIVDGLILFYGSTNLTEVSLASGHETFEPTTSEDHINRALETFFSIWDGADITIFESI